MNRWWKRLAGTMVALTAAAAGWPVTEQIRDERVVATVRESGHHDEPLEDDYAPRPLRVFALAPSTSTSDPNPLDLNGWPPRVRVARRKL